jgi:hypothetical protein
MGTIDRNAADSERLRRNMQRLKGGPSLPLVFNETPGGAINGTNAAFTLKSVPASGGLLLFVNGLLMAEGGDYNRSGKTVTFVAGAIPETGDWIKATYLLKG